MGAVYEVEHTQLGVHYALKDLNFDEATGTPSADYALSPG
jgi:hypothetical protein